MDIDLSSDTLHEPIEDDTWTDQDNLANQVNVKFSRHPTPLHLPGQFLSTLSLHKLSPRSGWASLPMGIRSHGFMPSLADFPPFLSSTTNSASYRETQADMRRKFTAKTDEKKRFIYKLDTDDIIPIPLIPHNDPRFLYNIQDLANEGHPKQPLLSSLAPNPLTVPDPIPLIFPRAPTYVLNDIVDLRYRRGYIYSTPITLTPESKAAEAEQLYNIATPPGAKPVRYDAKANSWIMAPLQGMIEMPPGVPFTVNIDGDKDRTITVACLQTLESLQQYPEFEAIKRYVDEVWDITWGTITELPIFHLDGTKLNSRSGPAKEGCADGSVSHGVTVEDVGDGYVQPAVQANSDEAVDVQEKLLSRLASLYRLIVPLCVSKQEQDVTSFRNADVNAVCCGSPGSGFLGVQRNLSSAQEGGTLAKSLDVVSGAWHTDPRDDAKRWTLIIGLLRLPPGSAVGDFMLGRSGLYARIWTDKNGRVHFFLLIKGNDPHSPISPTVYEEALKPFFDILEQSYAMVGTENRAIYVLYPTLAAFDRKNGVSMTQPTGFEREERMWHTFADEGYPALGSFDDGRVFMARERFMREYNFARMARLEPSLAYPTYRNLQNKLVVVEIPFDPELDADYVDFMRGAFLQHHVNCSLYNLRMTRPMFALNQQQALVEAEARYIDYRAEFTQAGVSSTSVSSAAAPISIPPLINNSAQRHSKKGPKKVVKKGGTGQPALRTGTNRPKSSAPAEDTDKSDNELWEVSLILNHRFIEKKGKMEYLIRWMGCGRNEDSWVFEHNIKAPDLLREYHRKLEAGEATDVDPVVYSLRKESNRTLKALEKLLDLDRMSFEYKATVISGTIGSEVSDTVTPKSCQNILYATVTWDECYADWNQASDLIQKGTILTHLSCASDTLQKATNMDANIDVMRRSMSLSICRSLRFLYQFQVLFGRDFFAVVSKEYRAGGFNAINRLWPSVSLLTQTVFEWVDGIPQARKDRSRKRVQDSESGSVAMLKDLFIPFQCLEHLQVGPTTTYTVRLPPQSQSLGNPDELDAFVQKCLIEIITHTIILPPMHRFDQHINRHRKVALQNSAESVLDRCLVRGAMLDVLVDWLDDDGIFASTSMLEVIASPSLLLGDGKESDAGLAQKIRKGIPIFAALESWLGEDNDVGDTQDVASTLSKAVQDALSHLAKVQHFSPSSQSLRKSRNPLIASLFQDIPLVSVETPLHHLLPNSNGLRLDMLAFMLREALNKHHNRLAGEGSLYRLIRGEDPLTSGKSNVRDADHYAPIRAHNTFQKLVENSFERRNLLANDYTLSNLLVIIGTGQGHKTQRFFTQYLHQKWFTSAAQCVQAFTYAWMENPDTILDNLKCWGTPCAWLAFELDNNSVPLFAKRIEPMFDAGVVEKWQNYQTSSRTYRDALQLSKESGIAGFGSGITQMQFANTLALLGLCSLPDCDTMASIIRSNKRMGAFEGLQRLGLNVQAGSSEVEVRDAFRCVFDALDHKLSHQDKQDMRFNAIFVEHLMCKVSRWEKMFPKKTRNTLRAMAEAATKSDLFGKDLQGTKIFPFHPRLDRNEVQRWIHEDRPRIGC